MKEAQDLIQRVKGLSYFEVDIPVTEEFVLNGRVPFDIKIQDDRAQCRVLARDIVEAERRVLEYFNCP